MAAKKRKPTRVVAKKVVKKASARVVKKASPVKSKARVSKTVAKKAPAAKVVRVAPVTKVDKAFSKGQFLTALSASTAIARKDLGTFMDHLTMLVAAHLNKKGPGHFTLPGLLKITIKHKPATKARKGTNPFTGEEMMFKAKPERNVVKIRPLQKLKAMV